MTAVGFSSTRMMKGAGDVQSIGIIFLLCWGSIIGYTTLGFPRKTVMLCSISPLIFLFLLDILLNISLGFYFWILIGAIACALAVQMCSEKRLYLLIVAASLLSVMLTIALLQLWRLCSYFDSFFAWILLLIILGISLYCIFKGRVKHFDQNEWRALWESDAEKCFRNQQIKYLLELSAETLLLIGLERMMNTPFFLILWLGIFLLLLKNTRTYVKNGALERENAYLRDSQETSKRFFHVIRSQRHDFMIHVHTIYGLLVADRFEACKEYVEKLTEEARKSNEVIPLDSPAVSALLSEYLSIGERCKIRITYSIRYDLSQIACTEFELNRIIGNMLQNAVDEVSQYSAENRWIELLILKRAGRSVIKTTNPFLRSLDELANVTEMNVTTKKQHEGLGLSNIERIAKKYGGAFFIEMEDTQISVIAQIPNGIGQEEDANENFNH